MRTQRGGSQGRVNPALIVLIMILAGLLGVTVWWYGRGVSWPSPQRPELPGKTAEKPKLELPAPKPEAKREPAGPGASLAREILEDRLADIAAAASPAVVGVLTEKKAEGAPEMPFFNDPMFRRFFGPETQPPGVPEERKEEALGSGVIVTQDGYILTNHHVVAQATSIKVVLEDKREFSGKVIGSDPETDIAVVKIEAADLAALPIGDSSKVRVGQVVLAIGNPFGLSHTVTMGIISARGRNKMGITDYEDFFQTDAAINPGNSGGALINLSGELIGVNTAIFSRTGGNEGIGFAIPSNQAQKIMETLIAHGSITRGFLGIGVEELNPDIASQLGLAEAKGALVGEVKPDTPAAEAGFEPGDVIVKMDGKDIESGADLRNRIAEMAPGASSTFEIIREGEHKTITATLAERPTKEELENPAAPRGPRNAGDTSFAGMSVANLSDDLARRFNIHNPIPGVVITNLDPNGRAADAGLEPGDIIYRMNRENITNVNDFKAAAKKAGKEPVLLQVKRGPASMFIVIPK